MVGSPAKAGRAGTIACRLMAEDELIRRDRRPATRSSASASLRLALTGGRRLARRLVGHRVQGWAGWSGWSLQLTPPSCLPAWPWCALGPPGGGGRPGRPWWAWPPGRCPPDDRQLHNTALLRGVADDRRDARRGLSRRTAARAGPPPRRPGATPADPADPPRRRRGPPGRHRDPRPAAEVAPPRAEPVAGPRRRRAAPTGQTMTTMILLARPLRRWRPSRWSPSSCSWWRSAAGRRRPAGSARSGRRPPGAGRRGS